MNYRALGRTGIPVSEISFGAGPVSGLMTCTMNPSLQHQTVERAVAQGVNWFDTAATYGDGQSESNLGRVLRTLGAEESLHVATKIRLVPEHLDRIEENVAASLRGSLRRLGRDRVTLLQLHNSITRQRGDQPTSIAAADVLGKGGVLEAFLKLQTDGFIQHFGLTGLGDADVLREVVRAAPWGAIQVCVNLLEPIPEWLATCRETGIGVIAIRVLAGGALAGQPPSEHTRKTKFFPLAVYEAHREKATQLESGLPKGMSLKEASIRFVLAQKQVATALIGLANPEQVDEAIQFAERGPLSTAALHAVMAGKPGQT
jgi:aryl-alcohol dehydrogenase-like predicted oxidoreductase